MFCELSGKQFNLSVCMGYYTIQSGRDVLPFVFWFAPGSEPRLSSSCPPYSGAVKV